MTPIRTVIAGDIGIYREGLAAILDREDTIDVVGAAGDVAETLDRARALRPDVLLLDLAMPASVEMVRAITLAHPQLKVLALCVPDDEGEVIACAEAGVAGYVTREASLSDVIAAVHGIARGEAICSRKMAASLLRHVAVLAAECHPPPALPLTAREMEVASLLHEGLTNKEIARRLQIELPTVKNHVHHILDKLNVRRRGDVSARILRAPVASNARSA